MRTSRSVRSRFSLLVLASALFAFACSGPRGATPLPEPPALDPARIGFAEIVATLEPAIQLSGKSGAAPPNATVRVTNLDSSANAVAATANAEGAFSLTMNAVSGIELRFQAVLDEQRSAPIDFIYIASQPPTLIQSPRHACVALSPGFELSFDAPGDDALVLDDACTQALTVGNPRARLALADFSLTTPLPLDVAPASSATLNLTFTPTAAGLREDVLFLDLTVAGETLRYPVTLFAP